MLRLVNRRASLHPYRRPILALTIWSGAIGKGLVGSFEPAQCPTLRGT
jgi:hypothetical protein